MSKNPFFLLSHTGKSLYQNNYPVDLLNSFCILNKTITSAFINNENNQNNQNNQNRIDFQKMKEYDILNNEKIKFNYVYDLSPFYLEKENFIANTFFNKVLENKSNFEKIHNDVNEFKMLQNEDKSNSCLIYYEQILNKIKQSGEIKKVEEQMKQMEKRLKNNKDYEIDNYSLISKEFKYNINNKDTIYYRRIKANGNSFYISFIYQYLKSLMSKNEENTIKEIYYIMEKHLNFLNNNAAPSNLINNNSKEANLGQMYISNSIKDELALNGIYIILLII